MSIFLTRLLPIVAIFFAVSMPSFGQNLTALARLDVSASGATRKGEQLVIDLSLTQAVPYRVFALDEPRRIVIDFREVNWDDLRPDAFEKVDGILDIAAGRYRPGWSRLVLLLDNPMNIHAAGMTTDASTGTALVQLVLEPADPIQFAQQAGRPNSALWGEPDIAVVAEPIERQTGERPLNVVLDPGHGGIDPGAEQGGTTEAVLMLQFARILKAALIRTGQFNVVLTRQSDEFVPLETRVSIARAAQADIFLSLHADALSEGRATGASAYTLSDTASDQASALLAQRHDRADLLAGIDLSDQDDVIATTLMELARLDTAPRSDKLADALVEGLRSAEIGLYKRPRLTAGFSVLKAPDIPSVLLELGFLSNPRDLEFLQSENWRNRAAQGITSALINWAKTDAAEAGLVRN